MHVLDHPERYAVLSGVYGAAASYLGSIAPYPNKALLRLMLRPDCGNEEMDDVLRFARAAAFGAYGMTATTIDHGFQAGRAVKASGRRPTREEAEPSSGPGRHPPCVARHGERHSGAL